jgi:hypothetical protein
MENLQGHHFTDMREKVTVQPAPYPMAELMMESK